MYVNQTYSDIMKCNIVIPKIHQLLQTYRCLWQKQHTPFWRSVALQNSGRAAFHHLMYLVSFKLMLSRALLSGGSCFSQAPVFPLPITSRGWVSSVSDERSLTLKLVHLWRTWIWPDAGARTSKSFVEKLTPRYTAVPTQCTGYMLSACGLFCLYVCLCARVWLNAYSCNSFTAQLSGMLRKCGQADNICLFVCSARPPLRPVSDIS